MSALKCSTSGVQIDVQEWKVHLEIGKPLLFDGRLIKERDLFSKADVHRLGSRLRANCSVHKSEGRLKLMDEHTDTHMHVPVHKHFHTSFCLSACVCVSIVGW